MLMMESNLRDEVTTFLGRRPTDEEVKKALPKAERKLQWIIRREGDANGLMIQPWYLGKLIQEIIESEKIKKAARLTSDISTPELYQRDELNVNWIPGGVMIDEVIRS